MDDPTRHLTVPHAAKQYDDLSQGMWVATDTLSGLLKQAGDLAIIIAVGTVAGTITIESVVGPIAGYAVAALELVRLLEIINTCSTVATTANSVLFRRGRRTQAHVKRGRRAEEREAPGHRLRQSNRRMNEDDAEVGDDVLAELHNIAAGDSDQAAQLRKGLERLRDGAGGPALQEMARDVLSGNFSLRSAVRFGYYQEAFSTPMDELRAECRAPDDSER